MGVTEAEGLTTKTAVASTTTSTSAKISSSSSSSCGWLVVDFDGTCSEKDTTPLLPKLASILENDQQHDKERRLSTFTELETEFFKLYNAAKENMCHKTMSLDQALVALDDASNHVTAKVSSSGILRGLGCVPTKRFQQIIDDNEEIYDCVRLRPGCTDVIKKATTTTTTTKMQKWKLGILSINWCPSLIDAALVQRIVVDDDDDNNQDNRRESPHTPIWSNDVDEDGVVSLQVPGALAKKQRISELKKSSSSSSVSNRVIYVGDSSTDLAALVEADIGILIGQSQSTIAIAKRWGVKVIPLKQWHHHHHHHQRTTIIQQHEDIDDDDVENENANNRILWTVDTWSEIGDFLFNNFEEEEEEVAEDPSSGDVANSNSLSSPIPSNVLRI